MKTDTDNGFQFQLQARFEFTELLVSHRRVEAAVNDGQWHHICATWENTAGSWNFFIDRASVANGTNFGKDHVIKNTGIVILGQDQDEYGGGFEQDQSFFGEMFCVNMWSAMLSPDEILHMSRNCSNGIGNYLRWSDFETGLHGNVTIVSPTSCSP